jgi:drug/metabolite transporter (DMT)-like permease
MNWILIAILPPVLWGISNYIDKYLLSKYFKGGGVGALMIFSSTIGVFLVPIIYFMHPEVVTNFKVEFLLISLNGMIFVSALLPYFYALQKEGVLIVTPLLQLIPVYSFVIGYIFLGETLAINQLAGGILIIIAAIFISIKFSTLRNFRIDLSVLVLMSIASLLFALNFVFFKLFALESDFYTTSFWEYIGYGLFAIMLFVFIKSYRKEFIKLIKLNSIQILSINGLNEVVGIAAKISFNVASLLVPVTLVWIVNGLQPLFIFVYGIILTVFFPRIIKEDISKYSLLQKLIALVIMFIGGIVMNL